MSRGRWETFSGIVTLSLLVAIQVISTEHFLCHEYDDRGVGAMESGNSFLVLFKPSVFEDDMYQPGVYPPALMAQKN